MNIHLPRNLPDRDSISDYLPSRSSLPSPRRWFGRRENTDVTIAVGLGAAALIGLAAGAYLISRDRALEKQDMR